MKILIEDALNNHVVLYDCNDITNFYLFENDYIYIATKEHKGLRIINCINDKSTNREVISIYIAYGVDWNDMYIAIKEACLYAHLNITLQLCNYMFWEEEIKKELERIGHEL